MSRNQSRAPSQFCLNPNLRGYFDLNHKLEADIKCVNILRFTIIPFSHFLGSDIKRKFLICPINHFNTSLKYGSTLTNQSGHGPLLHLYHLRIHRPKKSLKDHMIMIITFVEP